MQNVSGVLEVCIKGISNSSKEPHRRSRPWLVLHNDSGVPLCLKHSEASWPVSGGTIRLWRCSTVGNRPKFPYISYTFIGKLGLVDVHLVDMGTDSGLPLRQHLLGPTPPHALGTAGASICIGVICIA